jgi:arylsulfatase A-like enzyme
MKRAAAWTLCLLLGVALVGCDDEATRAPTSARNLVFISLDTLRRDHLPFYGYARNTAPAMTELSEQSLVFERAFAQETNTNPSHASMFTGLYPHVHGSRSNAWVLGADQLPVAQVLAAAGFRTAGFVSGLPMHREATGLERGFEIYDDDFTSLRRDGARTTDLALNWLRDLGPDDRFFLFVHLYDTHGPYHAPGRYAKLFRSPQPGARLDAIPDYQQSFDAKGRLRTASNDYVDRYDGAIRYVDDCVARLLEAIDPASTAVIVVSDHGETLLERFWKLDHGAQPFDEQLRVPLLLRAPGVLPRRVEDPVEGLDLAPTMLDLLGVPLTADRAMQGRSLAPILTGGALEPREFTFASSRAEESRHADRGYRLDATRRIHAARSDRFKLIAYPTADGDRYELFDLEQDPGETRNVAEHHPQELTRHREALEAWLGDRAISPTPEVDPELIERLRSLGYTQ